MGKSPKPRTRRSTGGKSRESEEESPDTLQKINLILEQAKQEAERSQAHQSQTQHQLVSLPVPFRPAEGGTLLAAQPGAPVQDLLIDPKTGQVVGRQSAPNSVTLTLVTSSAQDQPQAHQHPADLRVAVAPPRTGVPQPTVLPPRHDQQVRPAVGPVPRVVAAAPDPQDPLCPSSCPHSLCLQRVCERLSQFYWSRTHSQSWSSLDRHPFRSLFQQSRSQDP